MQNSGRNILTFGAGKMGRLIESFYSQIASAPAFAEWPQSLKTTVGIVLNNHFPMLLLWGADEALEFYNDPFSEIINGKDIFPDDLKESVSLCCPELWQVIKPMAMKLMVGGSSAAVDNKHIRTTRNNQSEDIYLTISCSLVMGDDARPAGVLVVCNETTDSVKSRFAIMQLHNEEQNLNEELAATNEELAAANEELAAGNEELFAANEELREANYQLALYNAEIQQKEEQLRESEEKYKLLFQHGPLPKWLYDLETLSIIDVNEMAVSKYGYTRDEFFEMTILDLCAPDELATLAAMVDSQRDNNTERFSGIFTHLTKEKARIRVELYAHRFRHLGRECVIIVSNDITEKELAYNKLKINKIRLTNAQKIAQLGSWIFDPARQVNDWSDELYSILEMPRTDLSPGLPTLLKLVHPADRQNFTGYNHAFFSGREMEAFEYRVVMKDGRVKWLRQMGKTVRDQGGDIWVYEIVVQDITVPKMLEISLEESNKRFAYASQATSQAIWEWNSSIPDQFTEHGYDELFGYSFPNHTSEVNFWASKVHPVDLERIWPMMLAARTNTEQNKWMVEYRFQKADGEYIYIKETAILLRDDQGKLQSMIGTMQDVTQQKNEERQMRLLESAVTHSNDAVVITEASPLSEPGPRVVYVNQAFTRMTGYTADEMIGKTPRILQGALSDKDTIKQIGRQLRNNVPCEASLINYRKNGEEFWVNFSINLVTGKDNADAFFVAIQRDISERKREEIELKKLADDLYRHNKELQQFGYVVSHNLRAPVANIMGISTLLEIEKDDPETLNRCVHDLKTSINRLDEIIIDLSKILSATDGSAELAKEKIDLSKLLRTVKKDLNNAAALSGAKITIPRGQVEIFSHKAYLHSVFYNLVGNAIKYRSAEPPVIDFTIRKEAKSIKITVTDNGMGIDLNKHMEDLFKPYKRLNSSAEGKGLGLFLVKNHIEALNGEITVESTVGTGTSFMITLPLDTF